MERSSSVVVLACLVLVVSMGVGSTPAWSMGASSNAPVLASTVPETVEYVGSDHATTTTARFPGLPVRRTRTNNTTARLVLPRSEVSAERFATVRIGMGSALQSRSDGVRHAHRRLVIEREFEAASSLEEKRNVIDRALIELEERAGALETRELAAFRDFSDGTISAEGLLVELARIDAAAREIDTTLDLLNDLGDRTGITRFDSRIRGIDALVGSLQGPVRNRASQTVAGEAPPKRVFVTGSETGVVLSMLSGGTYYRAATSLSNRRPDEENSVDSPRGRAEELYPWAFANGGYTSVDGALTANTYRITVVHSQGELVAYMDAGSADVYREVQTFRLSAMATPERVSRSNEELQVTLRRTFAGGPLFVSVEDAGTGATVNARVSVDGYSLGHTGADGSVRTIEPRAPYTVNVSTEDAEFSITIELPVDESEG